MSDFCTTFFYLLEKIILKKHELSCHWESQSYQERGQQIKITAVESSCMALSEILPKYSSLLVGWFNLGCLVWLFLGGRDGVAWGTPSSQVRKETVPSAQGVAHPRNYSLCPIFLISTETTFHIHHIPVPRKVQQVFERVWQFVIALHFSNW